MFPEETYAFNIFKLYDLTVALNSFKLSFSEFPFCTQFNKKILILVFFKPTSQTSAFSHTASYQQYP